MEKGLPLKYGIMDKTDLKVSLQGNMSTAQLLELVDIIRSFKKQGGSQQDALQVLEDLRNRVTNEIEEDRLLELMDFVVGHCSPQMRIW
ncbi:MAG: hypothetical protein EOO39_17650 [Cytophagaceae bacterium]|nr:MAG: hypothetical protein EOO39_17650 [Cytophagaceae bacterium]